MESFLWCKIATYRPNCGMTYSVLGSWGGGEKEVNNFYDGTKVIADKQISPGACKIS